MYREEDYAALTAQLRARLTALIAVTVALLAACGISFALRWPQAVTVALSVLGFGAFVCGFTMFVLPVKAYRKHVGYALHGHNHDTQGVFVSMERESVIRDGIELFPMTVNVGAGIRDDGDRLFYYDARLPRPDWQPGETLLLTSYDNRVIRWTRVKIKS